MGNRKLNDKINIDELGKNQLEEVLKFNQIGVWELYISTEQTKWSDMVYKIHELPLDFDHNKANGLEFYHPDYRAIITKALENCIVNDLDFAVDCILITAKKNQKWVRVKGSRYDEKVVGSFQDITEIKKNELKFKGIFNSTFSFIGFLDLDGTLLETNDTAINMANTKREEEIGKPFWDCYWWQISSQAQEKLKTNFKKAVSGVTVEYETTVWVANETPITILFSMKPIKDENGKVVYVVPEGRPIQDIIDASQKFKSVIEGTDAGTWEWNVQTGETVFNERWAEIAGYTLEELQPISIDTWMSLAHPDDLEESSQKLNECFEKKIEFYEMEARMKHKEGHWVWVYDKGKVFKWTEDGKPLVMYGTHQDITHRKEREEELRISEEAFRGNFENAAIGMALLDEKGSWLKVNTKLCGIIGYTKEELLKLTFQDITHPDDLDGDLSLLSELIEGRRTHYQMEKRYFHKNGSIVHIMLAVSMVKDKEDKVLYFISQIIDITKLKLTEFRLKSLLAENEAIMDATKEIVFITTNTAGVIRNLNVGATKLLGYKKKDISGKGIRDFIITSNEKSEVDESLEQKREKFDFKELLALLLNNENEEESDWTFVRKDGSEMPVILSISEIETGGQVQGYLIAATDISHIKFIQSQLEQKNEELEQFAFVAAHDLKEPLRGITTYLSVLQKKYSDQLDEKAQTYIENTFQNANRMKNLISDILDFSKTGTIGHEEINLDQLIKSVFKSYQQENEHNSVQLSATPLPILKGDASSFIQLFTNLIDNAIKYQNKQTVPKITVSAVEEINDWIFSVADNGIGIEIEFQEKVFEIFKRLHPNSRYNGTGIGLATCKKIISAYGGKIWFEANEPIGTIFKFTIPKKRRYEKA